MVDRIGRDSALAREAMRAAQRLAGGTGAPSGPAPVSGPAADVSPSPTAGVDFAQALESGIHAVDQHVQGADALPLDLLSGKVNDFHEIAVQLKNAELTFKFAMEIRNKLIDAYREIMRMSV